MSARVADWRRYSRRGILARTASAGAGLTGAHAGCGLPAGRPQDAVLPAGQIERGTKVTLLDSGGFLVDPLATGVRPLVQQWQQRTGLVIEPIDPGTASKAEKLQVLLAAGTPPDVVGIGGSKDPLGSLVRGGALSPLDPLMRRDKMETADYYGYGLEHFRVRNTQWALPQSGSPAVMFHNRELLARAGQQPPPSDWKAPGWRWADLTAAARAMTRTGEDPTRNVFGATILDDIKTPAIAVWSHGGDLFDKDHSKCTLDAPPAIEALQTLVDLANRHRVNPTPAESAAGQSRQLFTGGRAGLLGAGQLLTFIGRLELDKPGFPWGINAFPRGSAGRFTISAPDAHCVIKASRHQNEAWELIKLIHTPEFLRVLAAGGRGGISPRKSVMAEVLKGPDLPPGYMEVADLGGSTRRWPVLARWPEISDVLSKHFARLWPGDVSVRQVVTDIKTEVEPLLKERI